MAMKHAPSGRSPGRGRISPEATTMAICGQGEAVIPAAGHLHVGEQQVHPRMVLPEHAQGMIAVMGLDRCEACFFEDVGRVQADERIVIGDDGERAREAGCGSHDPY